MRINVVIKPNYEIAAERHKMTLFAKFFKLILLI